ncbi:hypothetical protein D3C80_1859560 [compost metagenome]
MAAPRTGTLAASIVGGRLRSLAAVELLADYLALNTHIVFLPCVVYGSLTINRAQPSGSAEGHFTMMVCCPRGISRLIGSG